jgi:beta-N-acetylhexosaminidase
MHVAQSIRRYRNALYTCFTITMCCSILLLSTCATTFASGFIRITHVNPSPTVHLTQHKVGESSTSREAVTRAETAKVRNIMENMSLDQKLGQLILVEYLGNRYQGSEGGLHYMVSQQFVGGFMYQYSNHNFEPPYNVAKKVGELSQQAMQDAKIPLMIATDQEGGQVNRLYTFHGYLPSASAMAATGSPNFAFNQGSQAAKWLLQLGINTDLAPVVDVHTVDPPILQDRMFGRTPQTVATYAGAFLNGLQTNGVVGCLKHFSGLGAISSDPHADLPIVNRNMTDLNNIDLAPYRLMIQKNHPAMIMSTDVLMPAIDPHLPAELSPKAITGVLRNQLGYDGVVITDGLYMGGISSKWSLAQASVLAIIAGNDMIEGPYTPDLVASVVTAFKQALQQGSLTMARINQAVERILLLKVHFSIIK